MPAEDAREAAVVTEVEVHGVTNLAGAVGIISEAVEVDLMSPSIAETEAWLNRYPVDFADVWGQEYAKRAMVIAAAGGHNVLMLWTIQPS